MAIDFPASPTNGQTFTSGALVYTYDGTKWTAQPAGVTGGTKIEVGNTKAEIVDTGSDGRFVVTTEGSERLRCDSDGRLLVGTSTARGNFFSGSGLEDAKIQIEGAGTESPAYELLSLVANNNFSNDRIGANIILARSNGTAVGSYTAVSADRNLGAISFQGADGSKFVESARIAAYVDGTPGADDMPGRLVFSTTADGASSPTERMRIANLGETSITCARSAFPGFKLTCSNATNANGIQVQYSGASFNNTLNDFIECYDSVARFSVRSNGGIANYSANNVNLSDRNAKKDIAPAAGTWDCLKDWEIVNFRYKDQPDDADLNMGVIAQQVAESCPEVITVFQGAKESTETEPAQEERLGVKDQQMMWMAIKALQEAMERIETLEAKVAALEAQ
jgi:hypothetical protein